MNDTLYIAPKSINNFHASYTVPYDIQILSLTPQANLICRSWQVYAMLPGETNAVNLLKIKEWNYNWKQTYHLESPILLPKGTVIHAFAHYDNTVNNLHNPSDPPDPYDGALIRSVNYSLFTLNLSQPHFQIHHFSL